MRGMRVLGASVLVILAVGTASPAPAQARTSPRALAGPLNSRLLSGATAPHADPPSITSGVRIEPKTNPEGTWCTAGPMAIPKDKDEKDKTYLLTAGHCIKNHGGLDEIWMAAKKVIGPARKAVLGKDGDFGAILIASEAEQFHITNEHGQPEVVEGEWQTGNPNDPVLANMTEWKNNTVRPVKGEAPTTESAPPETPCLEGATSHYTCGAVVAMGRPFEEEGAPETLTGLVEDLAKGTGGDSGGPYFTERTGEVFIQGTEIGRYEAAEKHTRGTLETGKTQIIVAEPGVTTWLKQTAATLVEVEGQGIPAGTKLTRVINGGTSEVEMSAPAGANIEATQPQPLTFKRPQVNYYEPIGTILNEWGLELLTTKTEKRKVKPELLLRTAVGLVGDGSTILGGISGLVVHSALGNLECPSGTLKGELTANEGKKDTGSFSELSSSCAGIEAGGLPWPIELTTKDKWTIDGTKEVLVTVTVGGGTCQFASKKLGGSFEPGSAGEATPLEIEMSEEKFKLNKKFKENNAGCPREAEVSGALTFTAEGETVEDEVT